MKDERLTVQETADMLGLPANAIRVLMDEGILRIGVVLRRSPKGRATYYIQRALVEKYLTGSPVAEETVNLLEKIKAGGY